MVDNPAFEKSPPLRQLGRSISIDTAVIESYPLRNRTTNSTLLRRWSRNRVIDEEAMVEDELPSDDFEYIKGGPSPPEDVVPNMYESFEDYNTQQELTVQICQHTIKMNLIETIKSNSGRVQLLEDIESKKTTPENVHLIYSGATDAEINISFLWAAFVKRWELLDPFLKLGAQLQYHENMLGMTALHLSAFSGCLAGTHVLMKQGADVNVSYKSFTPLHCAAFGDSPETAMALLNNGAKVHSLTTCNSAVHESVLHCAVRANAVACVKLFTEEGADVGQVEHAGMSPLHLAADLGQTECLKIMLDKNKGVDVNGTTKEKDLTALHLAAEGGFKDCVEILLGVKGIDINAKNHRGQTPLHLAARAQAFDCVEMLLKKGNADPNMGDSDLRTPLHAAVGKAAARSTDIVEILISWGADVSMKDQYGYTPLHLAAVNELGPCVEILIFHGSDVCAKTKFGMSALGTIARKTPASLAMVNQKLDSAITLHHHPEYSSREVELRLDFRSILQHSHPKEISALNTFVDEGQKELLLHPLCSAFLHLKWEKIRKFYIARIIFCFAYVLLLSLYVLTALSESCYPKSTANENITMCKNDSVMGNLLTHNPFKLRWQWGVLVILTAFEILRKIYGIYGYSTVKQYLSQMENILEWSVIVGVHLISCVYTGQTRFWQNHIGAFAVLFGWTNLMLMIGQLPVFGLYVAMYTKVQGEFAKLLLAYSCVLIGFTISFCVIFLESESFSNPLIGLLTVLTMMTGELDIELLGKTSDVVSSNVWLAMSAQLTFLLFIFFVTITLMNLLVGIAVHDIQGLQKTAGLSKLVRQTKLISYMELALFNGYIPKYILNILYWTALVSPKAYRVVLNVKPLNPREKRLPKDILETAYEVAKLSKSYGHTVSSRASSATTKTWLNYNTEKSGDYPGYKSLQEKMDKSVDNVEKLTEQVKEFSRILDGNQKVIEQLLEKLNSKDSKC